MEYGSDRSQAIRSMTPCSWCSPAYSLYVISAVETASDDEAEAAMTWYDSARLAVAFSRRRWYNDGAFEAGGGGARYLTFPACYERRPLA